MPKVSRARNKAQHLNEMADVMLDMEMNMEGYQQRRKELPHPTMHVHSGVIPETQLNGYNSDKGNICNAILASIRLDSPTPSRETWGGEGMPTNEHGHALPLVNIPICSSGTSLLALGKHVLTPRQGRVREHMNKSPLGG